MHDLTRYFAYLIWTRLQDTSPDHNPVIFQGFDGHFCSSIFSSLFWRWSSIYREIWTIHRHGSFPNVFWWLKSNRLWCDTVYILGHFWISWTVSWFVRIPDSSCFWRSSFLTTELKSWVETRKSYSTSSFNWAKIALETKHCKKLRKLLLLKTLLLRSQVFADWNCQDQLWKKYRLVLSVFRKILQNWRNFRI